jgi:acetyl esterase/lipase
MASADPPPRSFGARSRRAIIAAAGTPARVRLGGEMLLARGAQHRYGPHPSQVADLYLPGGAGPHAPVVLVHGGSWQKRYGKRVTGALASDLRRRGFAVWNIEYRRLGDGGGWPETFADVAAAIDHLVTLDAPLDTSRASVIGHSAGGHLALWAASRSRLEGAAPGAQPKLRFSHAVALAGVCDLETAYRVWRGGSARALMGGSPQQYPERYAIADPIALLPLEARALLVHGVADTTVTIELSRSYARAAAATGTAVKLVELEGAAGHHRAHIDPRSAAWRTAAGWLEDAHGGARALAAEAA